MLKSLPRAPLTKNVYKAVCSFSQDTFYITADEIFTELSEDGMVMVYAFANNGKTLIFSQQCMSVCLDDESVVRRVPKEKTIRKKKAINEEN